MSCSTHPPHCTATPAPDSCDHSTDLGVRCLTCHQVYTTTVEKLGMCESMITTHLSLSTKNTTDFLEGATDSTTSEDASIQDNVVLVYAFHVVHFSNSCLSVTIKVLVQAQDTIPENSEKVSLRLWEY